LRRVLRDQVGLGVCLAVTDRAPAAGRSLLRVDHGAGHRMPQEPGPGFDRAALPLPEEGAEVQAGSPYIEVVLLAVVVVAPLGEVVTAQVRDVRDRGSL